MRKGGMGLLVLVVGLFVGCATRALEVRSSVAAVIEAAGPVEATEEDELAAYAPEQYLAGQAGHGLGGDLDLSASCGCAETSGNGPAGSSGPAGGPGVEHKQTAHLRVIVKMPQLSPDR
jgi:hypothetical protein